MTKNWRIIIAVATALTPAIGWGQSYENDMGEVAGDAGARSELALNRWGCKLWNSFRAILPSA